MAESQGMRALKGAVIAMGILILVGLAVVVAAIVSRLGGERDEAFATLHLDLPESCAIAGVTAVAERAVLRLSGPRKDGCGRLVVVDPRDGALLGRIDPGRGPDGE